MKLLVLITLLSLSSLKVFADEAATPEFTVVISEGKILAVAKMTGAIPGRGYQYAQEVDYITVNNKSNGEATIKSTIPNSLGGVKTQAAISKVLYQSSWDCKITNAEVKSESITTTFYCKFHA